VTCYTQPCKPCKVTCILHYLPQGDESSPRGRWGIFAPALPEVLAKRACIPFIDMDKRPEDFDTNSSVGTHYLSTSIYLLVELHLGDFASCPMDE
jgi:hypothetical protein